MVVVAVVVIDGDAVGAVVGVVSSAFACDKWS